MAAFDWYQATVRAEPRALLDALPTLAGAGADWQFGNGRHSYGQTAKLVDAEGTVGEVWYGGTSVHPHVRFTGERSVAGSDFLRTSFPDHLVSRADAREDFGDDRAFERILPFMLDVATRRRIKVGCNGDWLLRLDDGRTLYLGSPSSVTRQRLYDKAAEMRSKFASDPVRLAAVPAHLARLEVQLRPATPAAKAAVAIATPEACMGASPWTAEVWQAVTGLGLTPMQLGPIYRRSDDDRMWNSMLAQYGGLLGRRAEEHGSGAAMGAQIVYDLAERKRLKRMGLA